MKKISILFGISLFVLSSSISQSLYEIAPMCDSCDHQLFFRFESSSFIKNNEYYNEFTKGFTGIGAMLDPSLEYYFTNNTRANVGIHLLKYAGKDDLTQIIPTFRIQHALNPNLNIILGKINGTLYHKLKEPLFRFDNYYQNNLETGLQLQYQTMRLSSDIWLNWENFILKNDPFQESFTFGTNTDILIFKTKSIHLSLPIQTLIFHKGGEIDLSQEPILTIFNGSVGLSLTYHFDEIKKLRFEPNVLWYDGLAIPDHGQNAQNYKNGSAVYFKLIYEQDNFSSMLGFWQAHDFIAPNGEYLFLSISDINSEFFEPKRQLITSKVALKRKVSNFIYLEFQVDTYYDFIHQNLDYSTGIYFLINEPFRLK